MSTARHLAELSATVVQGARRKYRLDAIVKEIAAQVGKALAVKVDITKREEVAGLTQEALKAYGKVDRLINNAGLTANRTTHRAQEGWDRMIDINISENGNRNFLTCNQIPHKRQRGV